MAGSEPGRDRVSQKLAELGPVWELTTGGYFEGSEGVHKLIGVLRDSWAKKQLLTTGRPAGEGEISQTIGLMRRRLSTAIVKANISVLLGSFEEMRMRREREAAWRAETTGREVVRRGQFWLGR